MQYTLWFTFAGAVASHDDTSKFTEITPTDKTVIPELDLATRLTICVLCVAFIPTKDDRRLIWKYVDIKSENALFVEKFLDFTFMRSVHTEIICRTCLRKLTRLEQKISDAMLDVDRYKKKIRRNVGLYTKDKL